MSVQHSHGDVVPADDGRARKGHGDGPSLCASPAAVSRKLATSVRRGGLRDRNVPILRRARSDRRNPSFQ